MDKFEQIVKYVDEYKEKVSEEQKITNRIKRLKSDLKNFMDTGNAHIFILFSHGPSNESLYPSEMNEMNPSDSVKEAIQKDVEKQIVVLEKELQKVQDRILVLRSLVSGR